MTSKKQREKRGAERGVYLFPILVGLTFAQREGIKRAAATEELSAGEWARNILTRAAGKIETPRRKPVKP